MKWLTQKVPFSPYLDESGNFYVWVTAPVVEDGACESSFTPFSPQFKNRKIKFTRKRSYYTFFFLLKRFKYWKFSVSLWPHKSKTQQKTLVAWKNSNLVKQNSKTLKKLVKMKVKREKIKEIFLFCYNSKKNYKRKNKDLDTGKVLESYTTLLYLMIKY